MRVAGTLVGEHHVGYWDMVAVVVLHDVAHISLVNYFGPITGASSCDEFSETLVRQWLANTYGVMRDAAVERCYHILPIVVVCRHQHHAAVGIVEGLEDFGVLECVMFANQPQWSSQVVDTFCQKVAHVAVILSFDASSPALILFGEAMLEVLSHHFDAVANQVVNNWPQ